jgi:predicted RNase H-like nuclease (RuvC/YqgF family)
MKVSAAWFVLVAAPAFSQTTSTDCHMVGASVQCASVTGQPQTDPLDDQMRREQQRLQAEQQKNQLRNVEVQKEALRQQNESLRQQTEAAQAERINTEVAALKSAWDKLKLEDQALPVSDRYPPELLPRIAINEAAQTLGRQPLDRSVEAFRRQIGQE